MVDLKYVMIFVGTVPRTDGWGWTLGVRGPGGFYQQYSDDGSFNSLMGGLGEWVGGAGDWMRGAGSWVGDVGSWARGVGDSWGNVGDWMRGQGVYARPVQRAVAGPSGYMGYNYGYPTYQ